MFKKEKKNCLCLQLGLGQIMLKPSFSSKTHCEVIGSYLQQHQKHHDFRTLFWGHLHSQAQAKKNDYTIIAIQF